MGWLNGNKIKLETFLFQKNKNKTNNFFFFEGMEWRLLWWQPKMDWITQKSSRISKSQWWNLLDVVWRFHQILQWHHHSLLQRRLGSIIQQGQGASRKVSIVPFHRQKANQSKNLLQSSEKYRFDSSPSSREKQQRRNHWDFRKSKKKTKKSISF